MRYYRIETSSEKNWSAYKQGLKGIERVHKFRNLRKVRRDCFIIPINKYKMTSLLKFNHILRLKS